MFISKAAISYCIYVSKNNTQLLDQILILLFTDMLQ